MNTIDVGGAPPLLDGVRVVDATGEYGAFASRLLADLGAEVVRVERPGATGRDRAPRSDDGVSLHHLHRNVGKQRAGDRPGRPTRAMLRGLLAGTDIVFVSGDGTLGDPAALLDWHPHLVVAVGQPVRARRAGRRLAGDRARRPGHGRASCTAPGCPSCRRWPRRDRTARTSASTLAAVAALMALCQVADGGRRAGGRRVVDPRPRPVHRPEPAAVEPVVDADAAQRRRPVPAVRVHRRPGPHRAADVGGGLAQPDRVVRLAAGVDAARRGRRRCSATRSGPR